MSVPFRQRTPGEYARIIWKRKWLIILPAIAIASAVTLVVLRLPDIYESHTLIVVKPSTIPETFVPTASEDTLTRQLTSITQIVTSRSSLQPLIEKYHLNEAEQQHGQSMESVVESMQKDIKVEVTSSKERTNGFNISYRGRDPRLTQAITAELATKYIDAQTRASHEAGVSTQQFFDRNVEQAKADLDEVDQKRLQFMRDNLSHLPDGEPILGTQLTGLYEQQKSLITEVGRLHDQQTTLGQRYADLQKQRQQTIDNFIEEANNPKKTAEYLQLSQREDALDAELRDMLTKLKPANPDVIKKKEELESVRAKMKAALDEGKAEAEEKKQRYEKQIDPSINAVQYEIEYAKNEMERRQKLLDDTNAQITSLQQRINEIPGAKVGLEALDREYQTRKALLDQLLSQKSKADLVAGMQTSQQAETIEVVDPANLPEAPVAPKRPVLILAGIMLGLFVGIFFAAVFEVPRLLTIQTASDAEHYTGLPVLVSVPELLTPHEASVIPRRRLMFIAAGIVATVLSIPVIAYGLKFTHILDRFVS
ncbi:MAG TPA: GNVR domain-containing protein [Pyrinomonadaceae bacterium]|nr:GNVR domain-containing protein [Pyrinomonadaceae bacterium]